MKSQFFLIIFVSIFLFGCDKLTGGNKEKFSWSYSEDIDKLNNSKIIKAKKVYKNEDQTIQGDVEFQCNTGNVLVLQISTYQAKVVNGIHPGIAQKFNTAPLSEIEYIKTRSGENKIAFPVLNDAEFTNISKISLSGIKVGFLNLENISIANQEITGLGYKFAAIGKDIPKFFKTSEWVIEAPTVNGKLLIEIDLSNENIQKIMNNCSWKPDFIINNGQPEEFKPQEKSQLKSDQSVSSKNENLKQCLDGWVSAYRTEQNDQEAIVRADMLTEWEDWCKKGKLPSN